MSRTNHGRSSARHGFTLIEVMMATFIIGLGVLGLLALFAGAARQQQIASQTTSSVQAANNAVARLSLRVGQLEGPGLSTLSTTGNRVWYAAKSRSSDDPTLVLTLEPSSMDRIFALIEPSQPTPIALYERPLSGALSTVSDPGFPAGGAPDGPFVGNVRALPDRRIDPDTIQLEVVLVNSMTNAPERRLYSRPPMDDPNEFLNCAPPNQWAFWNGGVTSTNDFVVIDVQESPLDAVTPARLAGLNIPDAALAPIVVDRVELADYRWRSDELLSLSDRLVYAPDATAPGGRRPTIGFAVLYRKFDAQSQVALFSYTLTPPSGSAVYVPPETPGDDTDGTQPFGAPLSQVSATLGWDETRQEYYFETLTPEASWVLEPGQELLVGQCESGCGDLLSSGGSDLPVRVVSRVEMGGGLARGYLNDSPRNGNRSYLPSRASPPAELSVWGIRDRVRSQTDRTGPAWRLRPLDVQVIQVVGN